MRQQLVDDELGAHDLIEELVRNESKFIKSLYRPDEVDKDDVYKMFVNILRFGSGGGRYVYWLQEPEGDSTGYFGSMLDATVYADVMYLT